MPPERAYDPAETAARAEEGHFDISAQVRRGGRGDTAELARAIGQAAVGSLPALTLPAPPTAGLPPTPMRPAMPMARRR